jgi:hypothetical protein
MRGAWARARRRRGGGGAATLLPAGMPLSGGRARGGRLRRRHRPARTPAALTAPLSAPGTRVRGIAEARYTRVAADDAQGAAAASSRSRARAGWHAGTTAVCVCAANRGRFAAVHEQRTCVVCCTARFTRHRDMGRNDVMSDVTGGSLEAAYSQKHKNAKKAKNAKKKVKDGKGKKQGNERDVTQLKSLKDQKFKNPTFEDSDDDDDDAPRKRAAMTTSQTDMAKAKLAKKKQIQRSRAQKGQQLETQYAMKRVNKYNAKDKRATQRLKEKQKAKEQESGFSHCLKVMCTCGKYKEEHLVKELSDEENPFE